MTLKTYLAHLETKDLKARTTCFLHKGDKILLGLKKEGIGEGYYVGIGGKQEKGETLKQTVKRELAEEINVTAIKFRLMATLNFYFIQRKEWNQKVHAFICDKWKGEISGSEEIEPQWFKINALPFDKMWEDALFYLPFIVRNKRVEADFLYNSKDKVVDCRSKIYLTN